MGFRIMQLQYETMKEEAKIEEGITLEIPIQMVDLGFGQIQSLFTPSKEKLKVATIHEYNVEEKKDGFKKIKITPSDQATASKEEGILLIIRQADLIENTAKINRLAGRYPGEGIFLLKPNEKIKVTRGKLTEEFAALQFENKMYLVKVHEN